MNLIRGLEKFRGSKGQGYLPSVSRGQTRTAQVIDVAFERTR